MIDPNENDETEEIDSQSQESSTESSSDDGFDYDSFIAYQCG